MPCSNLRGPCTHVGATKESACGGGVGAEDVDGLVSGVEPEIAKGIVLYAPCNRPRTDAICEE